MYTSQEFAVNCFYFIQLFCAYRDLHSFPTRRSSDLGGGVISYVTGSGSATLTGHWRTETDEPFGDGSTVGYNRFEGRSEEHTSELQSHSDLVCRLLLEKKKQNRPYLRTLRAQNFSSI